jgi:hypothetical protein
MSFSSEDYDYAALRLPKQTTWIVGAIRHSCSASQAAAASVLAAIAGFG